MNIEKIRSALEFARTRTPAGGHISCQAADGLRALAEVEREIIDARALIEKAADVTWGFRRTADYPVTGALHTELRAFLEPVTPGKVAYTYGDAPNPPDSSPLPPAVCMKCGDDRNQPSKFCDHGKATPEPTECGCAARKALERLQPWMNAINHVHLPDGSIQYASEIWDALAAPCDCAGLREEYENERMARLDCVEIALQAAAKFRGDRDALHAAMEEQTRVHLIQVNELHQRSRDAEQALRNLRITVDKLRAELAAMTADRDQWKALKDRVEEEKARLQNELAAALEREREAVELLRRSKGHRILDDGMAATRLIAAFDARKEK